MYIVSWNKDKQLKPYLNVLIAPNLLMGPMSKDAMAPWQIAPELKLV